MAILLSFCEGTEFLILRTHLEKRSSAIELRRVNPGKMEVLLVASSSVLGSDWTPVQTGLAFASQASVRSLGILLVTALLLDVQMVAMAKCAYYLLASYVPFLIRRLLLQLPMPWSHPCC